MSDITIEKLDAKIDAVESRLHRKIDEGFTKAFEQTQGGFSDHRAYAEFLVDRLNKQMTERFTRIDRRFDGVDERFDRLEGRFDRLEKLIKEQPVRASTRRRRS